MVRTAGVSAVLGYSHGLGEARRQPYRLARRLKDMTSRRRAGRSLFPRVDRRRAAAAAVLTAGLLAGCSGNAGSSAPSGHDTSELNVVNVSASACGTGWQHPTAGVQTLQIRNTSTATVEVQLLNPANGAVYAQVEGIGPGTTRSMPVNLGSGQYSFSCSGEFYGNRTGAVVSVPGRVSGGTAILPLTADQVNSITQQARAYVTRGLAALVPQTAAIAAAIRGGNLSAARTAWLTAHLTWERLGSAYGMFGPYDDEIDGLPFGLAGGVNDPGFTGFYRLEYGLWHGQSATELTTPASQLNLDVRQLQTSWPGIEPATTQAVGDLALRTHEVLEDASQNQLSGLDDLGSGTTLATFAAGLDATRTQLGILDSYLVTRYPQTSALFSSLDRLERRIDAEKTSRGWTPARDLSTTQREQLDAAAGQTVELLAPIPVLFEQERLVP
jgi:iron uptake system component EfeO